VALTNFGPKASDKTNSVPPDTIGSERKLVTFVRTAAQVYVVGNMRNPQTIKNFDHPTRTPPNVQRTDYR
jgi:hypothetical protein